jgi:hypothetical protein
VIDLPLGFLGYAPKGTHHCSQEVEVQLGEEPNLRLFIHMHLVIA